uniref:Uncharacterized protein n=1 Tax=Heterorhabditis bacteriophora TaxID=37862 RepID=A0A1I7WJ95_HETBA
MQTATVMIFSTQYVQLNRTSDVPQQ